MAEESIYRYIARMAEEHPGLPYIFQDARTEGQRDVRHVMWGEDLPFLIRERYAMELADCVAHCLEEQKISDELRKILDERPIYQYLSYASDRVGLMIKEKLVDASLLYRFGMHLATQSDETEAVKLGILILGNFENDVVRKTIKTLGLHSAFTLYALEASTNLARPNQFIFDLAQNTRGYGKLAALHLLSPVTPEQRQWMLVQGIRNEAAPNMSAIMCLEKVDMAQYYSSCVIDEANFSHFSYLFAYAFEQSNVKDFTHSLTLVQKYMEAAPLNAQSFIDLAALIAIRKSMAPYWHQHGVDVEKENGWSSDKENAVYIAINQLLKQPKWVHIAQMELDSPRQTTGLVMLVLRNLHIVPAFEAFVPVLERDWFDIDVLGYLLAEHAQKYTHAVFDYLCHVLPDAVFDQGPLDLAEEDISAEHKPDIWLVYLLKAMRKLKYYVEEFFLRCVSCRFPDVRIEAIQALRACKPAWSNSVMGALEVAYFREPVHNISKRILRLMGKGDGNEKKQQRYVDITAAQAGPSAGDIVLMQTQIAGTFFRDLMVVEGQLEVGDVLCLLREPENQYDEKAILVTAEDGYVLGYIPRVDNALPASLMDSGEKLYAVLESSIQEKGRPEISLFISRQIQLPDKVIPFPMQGIE